MFRHLFASPSSPLERLTFETRLDSSSFAKEEPMASPGFVGVALLTAAISGPATNPAAPPTVPVPPTQSGNQERGSPLFSTKTPYEKLALEMAAERLAIEKQRVQQDRPRPEVLPKERIVCGMRVIQADPAIDPKMVLQVPTDNTDFKIRRIESPVCKD